MTRKDKIKNEHTRGATQASKKITKAIELARRDDERILRKVLGTDIPGKMKIGRAKTRWTHGDYT